MKKGVLIGIFGLLFCTFGWSQSSDMGAIEQTIMGFSQAADRNNVKALEQYLDHNYHIVMNRLFGSKEVNIIDRTTYLKKIASKEWGGDRREVSFRSIVIEGNNAVALVELKGSKMTMKSLFSLVKNEEGSWKLIADIPTVQ